MSINQTSYALGAQKSAIREIAAYGSARKQQIGAENVFDFSLGNPSVPAPDAVRDSIAHALTLPATALHGYTPAAGLPAARTAVANSLNRRFATSYTMDDLYLSCGAAASISIALNAICNPGDEVIVIAPYFPEYKVFIENAGARCVEVMADAATFQVDVDAVAEAITDNTRAVMIDSPNNPVGVVYSRENLEALAQVLVACSKRIGRAITLISDEPYREIAYDVEVPWVPDIYANTMVCYSYSKSLSLPGERIGWVLVPSSNPEHDDMVLAVAGAGRRLGYVCAPSLFQRVLIDCVDAPCDLESYANNRRALMEGLDAIGYQYIEPQGAFYLWMRALEDDANAFYERARSFELLPVPSDSFGCGGWVRVGYCVSLETIQGSMGAWKALWDSYHVS